MKPKQPEKQSKTTFIHGEKRHVFPSYNSTTERKADVLGLSEGMAFNLSEKWTIDISLELLAAASRQ